VRLTLVADTADYGGAEAYLLHLLRHLPERFTATLLLSGSPPARLLDGAREAGVPVVAAPGVRHKRDLARMWRLGRALAATRADLVHFNLSTPANNRHAIAVAALQRRRTVATFHLHAPIDSRTHRAVLQRIVARLDRIIAVSQQARRQLCDELRVPPAMVSVIANGVEPAEPVAPREARPVRVGAVGRLVVQKGFDVLAESVRLLAQDGIPVAVAVAGDGPERTRLEAMSAGLPISFVPFVDDVDGFLRSVDVFCLPSRWEGLPFVLLEAMMRGLPCVATDTGDVAAALGGAGVVVPPGNAAALAAALTDLVRSPSRRRTLGESAHRRAREMFSVQSMVDATVAVYDDVLRG
jgi:glycosyltransferase involved in cell wall biosynthesis